MQTLALGLIALASALSYEAAPSEPRSLTSGDWVGQVRIGDSARFVRLRFASDTSGRADLPLEGRWGLRLTALRRSDGTLTFALPVPGDTLVFTTLLDADSLTGAVRSGRGTGVFRSMIGEKRSWTRRSPIDRKSTRLNSSHSQQSRMPSSA